MPTYTQTDVDELLRKMAAERARLLAAAHALRPAEADAVPLDAEGEEQWTAKEQLAHLWEMERGYVATCRAALAENGCDATQIPAAFAAAPVAIPVEDAPGHRVAELVEALIAERARTVTFIAGIPLAGFAQTARTVAFGELTVMQWLRSFYRHDRQHGAQIEGRASEYQPNFAGGVEPNQRRMRMDLVRQRRPGPPPGA